MSPSPALLEYRSNSAEQILYNLPSAFPRTQYVLKVMLVHVRPAIAHATYQLILPLYLQTFCLLSP